MPFSPSGFFPPVSFPWSPSSSHISRVRTRRSSAMKSLFSKFFSGLSFPSEDLVFFRGRNFPPSFRPLLSFPFPLPPFPTFKYPHEMDAIGFPLFPLVTPLFYFYRPSKFVLFCPFFFFFPFFYQALSRRLSYRSSFLLGFA